VNDIDTDQIIPARFLKGTDKAGLGRYLFADWRYDTNGNINPYFVLNKPASRGAEILLAGGNFGCGSSREHAPWALRDFGFRAVISTSFADIFRNNALKNGLLPIDIDALRLPQLLSLIRENVDAQLTIDLKDQTVTLPDGEAFSFPIDGFSKYCLLNGVDELGYLLRFEDRIDAYEAAHG
jgi:3-isopropylmalate/(R)-2-methylmalate dehydratase small subunit